MVEPTACAPGPGNATRIVRRNADISAFANRWLGLVARNRAAARCATVPEHLAGRWTRCRPN